MDIIHNPVILFFIFGMLAGGLGSSLEIPPAIAKFLSLYLLMAIGLKGGLALFHSGFTPEVLTAMAIALGLAVLTPIISYQYLRHRLDGINAAALAATYGSISAVTFVTAKEYLSGAGVSYDDYMSAAMSMMEAPAIVVGLWYVNRLRGSGGGTVAVMRDSFMEGANLLLIASLIIGYLAGDSGYAMMKPFTGDLFSGMLAFFLLDMGIQVARNMPQVRGLPRDIVVYGLVTPLLHAGLALGVCGLLSVSLGNTVLLMVLAASASYIAVPAALRHSVPEANPSVYLGLSLGVTFPFNVILGIPLYHWWAMAVTS